MLYVAYPIDQAANSLQLRTVLDRAHRLLDRLEIPTYWPGRAFCQAMGDPVVASQINNAAVALCSGMFAILLDGIPTFGTPIEVDRASRAGKPVAVISDGTSMQLAGMRGVRQFQVGRIEEAIDWLRVQATAPQGPAIRWTGDPECRPVRHYNGDAGFDLVVSVHLTLLPNQFRDVPHGINVELPQGVWALLHGRSSAVRKRGLLVTPSIIDQGYRGPMFAGCYNLSGSTVTLKPGDRVAQLIPMPLVAAELRLEYVEELDASDRGENGFGSTDELRSILT